MAEGSTISLKLLIQATNRASSQVEELRKQLNQVSQEAVKLGQQSKKAASQGQEGMSKFGQSTNEATGLIKKAKDATEGLSAAGGVLLGIAATLAGSQFFPVRSTEEFQKEMSHVLAVTSEAQEHFEELKRTASELGRTTVFTAKQAAEGMVYLGMAGLDATEVIKGIAPALNLAVAANVSVGESADIATNILAAMRLKVEDLTHATDVLASTTASSNTNLLELAEGMKYAGPLAAAAGVSLEEVAAVMGTLANNGIKGSMAGTAIRGMLRALTAPTATAKAALEKLNVQVKTNADGTVDLINAIEQLGEAQLSSADATAIFGRFAAAGALAVSADVDGLKELIKVNNESAGATRKMADTMKDNLSGAFTLFTSALDGLKRAIAEPLITPLTNLFGMITKIVQAIANLANHFPIATGVMGGMVFVAALLTGALGTLAIAITGVVKGLGVLQEVKIIGFLATLASGSFTAAGALGTLKVAVLGLVEALVKFKWATFIGVIVGVITVILEMSRSVDKAIEKHARLATEFGEIVTTYSKYQKSLGDLVSKYGEAAKKSDEYTSITKNMREELLKTASSNSELSDSAKAAAASISAATGEFYDAGDALDAFIKKSQQLQLKESGEEVEALAKKVNILLHPDNSGIAGTIVYLRMLGKAWKALIPGGYTANDFIEEYNNELETAQKTTVDAAKNVLDLAGAFKMLDLKASTDQVRIFVEEVAKLSDTPETTALYVKAFEEENKKRAESIKLTLQEVWKTSDEGEKSVEKQITDTRNLKKEYDALSVSAKAAAKASTEDSGDEKKKQRAVDLLKQEAEARSNLDTMIAASEAKIDKLKEFYLNQDKDRYDDRKKALQREIDGGVYTEAQGKVEMAKIDEQYEKDKQASIDRILGYAIHAGVEDWNQASKVANEKTKADKKVENAHRDTNTAILALDNQLKSDRIALAKETASTLVDLMAEGPKKYAAQSEAEQKALDDAAKLKGLQGTEEVEKAKAAIRMKYAQKTAEWEIEQSNTTAEIIMNQNKKDLDRQAALIDASYKRGEMSAKDYVDAITTNQENALKAQLAYIQTQLKNVDELYKGQDPEAVKAIKVKLEADATEVKAEIQNLEDQKPTVTVQLELQQKGQDLSTMNQVMSAELNAMNENNLSMLDKYYAKRREIMQNSMDQELVSIQQTTGMGQEYYRVYFANLMAMAKQESDDEKAITEAKLNWAADAASMLSDTFSKAYELSGEKSKALFYLQKAAAIAQIIINTQVAAMKALGELGPTAGKVMQAIIYAQGAAAIATVGAQQMAEGGEVQGKSPHKKADNIWIKTTAKEWVHPVDSVNYYGKRVMAGIQKRIFPKELFEGYSLPVPRPVYSGHFASGGEVGNRNTGSSGSSSSSSNQSMTYKPQPINIVNVVDPAELDRYMSTTSGQNAVLNILSSRSETVKRLLK